MTKLRATKEGYSFKLSDKKLDINKAIERYEKHLQKHADPRAKPLPCVFCRKRPKIAKLSFDDDRKWANQLNEWVVECDRGNRNTAHYVQAFAKTEETAIERWNKEFGAI